MTNETELPYECRLLPDLPVILGTWKSGFKFAEHGKQFSLEVRTLLDAQTSPVYYMLDMSQLEEISIDGVILAANQGARGANPNLHHPMNCGNIFVSQAAVIHMTAKGMDSSAFGNVKVRLFATLEEALDYVRTTDEAKDAELVSGMKELFASTDLSPKPKNGESPV
jgi:hypothetical protein